MSRKSPLSLAILAILSTTASAGDQQSTEQSVERILVQGDFRQQQLQKLPGSILVLSQQDISRQNAQHLDAGGQCEFCCRCVPWPLFTNSWYR
jgi:iron complex outermembrane receptor protein